MVPRLVCGADASAVAGMAGDRARRVDAHPGAHRQRQDADGVPLVHQPADVRADATRGGALPRALHLAAESSCCRHRAQLACAARRHRESRGRARRPAPGARGGHPHRGHAGCRARTLPARSRRHPDYDAGVALPAAHVQRARGAPLRGHRHRGRDPRARPHQAGSPPGALARAPGTADRSPPAAHRSLRNAASARRSGAFSGRGDQRAPAARARREVAERERAGVGPREH